MNKVYSFKTTTGSEIDFERISRENNDVPIVVVKTNKSVIILVKKDLNTRFISRMSQGKTSYFNQIKVTMSYLGKFYGWFSIEMNDITSLWEHPTHLTKIMVFHVGFITSKAEFEVNKYQFYSWFNELLQPPKNKIETEVFHYT